MEGEREKRGEGWEWEWGKEAKFQENRCLGREKRVRRAGRGFFRLSKGMTPWGKKRGE